MNVRLALFALVLLALALPAAGHATVPPKNCGALKVGSRTFIVKADQMPCATAKSDAKAYIRTKKKPKGFACRNFTGSKMTFRCSQGIKVFFAIKR